MEELIDKRHVPEFVSESYELLETLFRTSIQLSENEGRYFNVKYHRLFSSTLFRIWDKKLSKITTTEPLGSELLHNEINQLSQELNKEEIEISSPSLEQDEVINYLHYCIERLEFTPFKEFI